MTSTSATWPERHTNRFISREINYYNILLIFILDKNGTKIFLYTKFQNLAKVKQFPLESISTKRGWLESL